MIVAAAGVVMNGVIAAFLFSGSRDLNIRSTFIHMLGDTVSTAAVIVGGLLIVFTALQLDRPGALPADRRDDPVELMVHRPRDAATSCSKARRAASPFRRFAIRSQPSTGVLDVHDLHVWSLGSQTRALATHVTIDDIPPSESNRILGDIRAQLLQRYGIYHTTVQFEHAACGEPHGCVETVEEAQDHSHAGHQH